MIPGGVPGRVDAPTTPSAAGDVGEPRDEGGVVGVGAGDDGDRIGAAGREPLGQRQCRGPDLGGAGERAGVAVLEAGAQEGQTQQDQEQRRRRRRP